MRRRTHRSTDEAIPTPGGTGIARRLLAVTALASALALSACADDAPDEEIGVQGGDVATPAATGGIGDWDTNRDARLADDEFRGWWRDRGVYNRWNTDGADGLTGTELSTGMYGMWDRNEAGLTEAEWNGGTRAWFARDASYGTFGDWDANDDNLVDENEYRQGLERHGDVLKSWDRNADNLYEDDELLGGFFDVFDVNDDRGVDENEWNGGNRDWDWGF